MIESSLLSLFSPAAMVLAAGFGMRMRPLTNETPKPLLKVGGKVMLDYALDLVFAAGFSRAVVNAHYLAPQIKAHVEAYRNGPIHLSLEEVRLETGGGIKKALSHFEDKPFFVLGSDLPVIDGPTPTLELMARAWDPSRMDALLLMVKAEAANGFSGHGDYMMKEDGCLWRKGAPEDKPYVYISVMIVSPRLYDGIDDTVFSNNLIFDRAEASGRLYGLLHEGTAYHVGRPDDLHAANELLESGKGWG